uniref:Uncharacterized protein n=1 Tax=Panagrolaimus sp. ES5 TaxID=591445 RepID=A0AC34G578_9BILA
MSGIIRKLSESVSDVAPPEVKQKSSAAIIQKVQKKLILHREILEDVFLEIIQTGPYGHYSHFSKSSANIEKFMLSGVLPFEVALAFFRKTQKVELNV